MVSLRAVSRRSDVELDNKKLSKTHIIPDLSLILNGSKNKIPCFHRTI